MPQALPIGVLRAVTPESRIAALVCEARQINDRLRALVVLNAADAQGTDNAAAAGRPVLELTPRDPKAVQELAAVVKAVIV